MIMDKEQQKIDVRISDIIVSIAPAAVRTLIGVTSSLGTLQVKFDILFIKEKILIYFNIDKCFRRKRKS